MASQNVEVETLKNWLEADEVVLVDVRELAEYAAGSIPGSVLIPLSAFDPSKIPSHEGKKLVIQCRSGARSYSASEALLARDPDLEVYNLGSGILGWAAAGFYFQHQWPV